MEPATAEFLIAIILCVFVGGALGNYATSFVHRLPAKEPLFDRDPFCASCNTYLKPRDLFPLLSYLMNRAKCRYCDASIPAVHFIVELLTVAIVLSAYFTLGLTEPFLLMCVTGIFWLILAMIAIRSRYIEKMMLYWLFGVVIVLRVLLDASIYPAFFSGLVLVMIGGYAYQKKNVLLEVAGLWVLCALALPWPAAVCIVLGAYLIEYLWNTTMKQKQLLSPLLAGIAVYTALLLSF